MSLSDKPQLQLKTARNKFPAWLLSGLLLATSLALISQFSLTTQAQSSDSQINGEVCSGGYTSPSLINTFPLTGSTVTQANTQITFTADWVTSITIKRGTTTLASLTGSNQSNETLSAIINLKKGSNPLSLTISGGCPQTTSTISYQLNYVPNSANVTDTTTKIKSPQLFGHYSPLGVRVFVVIAGRTYEAIANPDLTWVIPEGIISPLLSDGDYDIRVYTVDSSNNIVYDKLYPNAVAVDTTAPEVSINNKFAHTKRSPKLDGRVNDPNASVVVRVNGYNYTAINRRDGSWYLPAGTIANLSNGSYLVTVTAEDGAGNRASVSTTLRIKAPNQVDFILAPNTGYLRLGKTNIASSYLYMIAFILLVAIVWLLIRIRRRLLTRA